MTSAEEIEISELDTRFEGLKTRNLLQEDRLLAALVGGGEVDALLVARVGKAAILLDGFKRWRCLKKMKQRMAPCVFIANDEQGGVIELFRRARGHKMNMYEEAGFVQELHRTHGLNHADISHRLGRSKSWVSMRIQFFTRIPEEVNDALRTGSFPLHAWMYSVRPFMRVNKGTDSLAVEFVSLMKGASTSLREIELLSREWFDGGEKVRNQIREGHQDIVLKRLNDPVDSGQAMSASEQKLFKQLHEFGQLIRSICNGSRSVVKGSGLSLDFKAQAGIACMGILANITSLKSDLEKLHAEC